MYKIVKLFLVVAAMSGIHAAAYDYDQNQDRQIEIMTELEEQEMFSSLSFNPPGSKWISVRCERNSTCYPPAGFKFRNFNVEKRGSDCKGRYKRQTKVTKDYIKTSRECTVRGRIFVVPQEYCRGNQRFCQR